MDASPGGPRNPRGPMYSKPFYRCCDVDVHIRQKPTACARCNTPFPVAGGAGGELAADEVDVSVAGGLQKRPRDSDDVDDDDEALIVKSDEDVRGGAAEEEGGAAGGSGAGAAAAGSPAAAVSADPSYEAPAHIQSPQPRAQPARGGAAVVRYAEPSDTAAPGDATRAPLPAPLTLTFQQRKPVHDMLIKEHTVFNHGQQSLWTGLYGRAPDFSLLIQPMLDLNDAARDERVALERLDITARVVRHLQAAVFAHRDTRRMLYFVLGITHDPAARLAGSDYLKTMDCMLPLWFFDLPGAARGEAARLARTFEQQMIRPFLFRRNVDFGVVMENQTRGSNGNFKEDAQRYYGYIAFCQPSCPMLPAAAS